MCKILIPPTYDFTKKTKSVLPMLHLMGLGNIFVRTIIISGGFKELKIKNIPFFKMVRGKNVAKKRSQYIKINVNLSTKKQILKVS
jgi:hypothetical protein